MNTGSNLDIELAIAIICTCLRLRRGEKYEHSYLIYTPEPSLLAYTKYGWRLVQTTFKTRSSFAAYVRMGVY